MSSLDTRQDPFYVDFYHTFGKYPNQEEHEYWRALSIPFTMYMRMGIPKERFDVIFSQSVEITAKDMGMLPSELFKLIEGVAHEYYQACQNLRPPMQYIRMGDLIPDKYGMHKLSIALHALTYLEMTLGLSRFGQPNEQPHTT